MPIKTKPVCVVTVMDPDSGAPVQVEIRKLETGGMVGIDGSWLESDEGPVYSPYDRGVKLDIPDDEQPAQKPKHEVWIVWGEPSSVRELGEDAISYYSFDTLEALNAFTQGISEAMDWNDAQQCDTEQDAKDYLAGIIKEYGGDEDDEGETNEVEVTGGVMQWDNGSGEIRFVDDHGNTEGIWRPDDADYAKYKADYFPNHKIDEDE